MIENKLPRAMQDDAGMLITKNSDYKKKTILGGYDAHRRKLVSDPFASYIVNREEEMNKYHVDIW